MELVEGPTLADRIAHGPVPLTEALPIAKQIAEALEAAHEQGIIHRDLKPANIKVRGDGTVKVLDFGLAKLVDPVAAAGQSTNVTASPTITSPAMMTGVGVILGTASYMSPEQARGRAVDKRSDLWAFGAVLYEMLTGQRAFGGEDVSDTLAHILMKDPAWTALPTSTPAPIRKLLRRCLEKDRKRRLPDAADARLEIDDALTSPPEVAVPPVAAPRTRERLAWIVIALLVIAVAAMAVPATHYLFSKAMVEAPEMRLDVTTPPTSDPVSLAISPDGRQLVFVASPQGNPQLWLRRLDSVKAEPLAGTERASYPFWSPDSRSIGFFADGKLKRLDIAGGPAQIVATVATARGASWGPDRVILLGIGTRSIARVSATGGEPAALLRLEPGQTGQYFPQWLPDGRHFLYTVLGTPAVHGMYVASVGESVGHRLLSEDSVAVYVPPGFLLFVRGGVLLAQRFDVERMGLVGEPFRLADDVAFTPGTGAAALSASTSGTIVYRTAAAGPTLAWFDRMGREVGLVKGSDRANPIGPELSPDGQRLAVFRTVDGNRDIYVIDVTRGITTRFTVNEAYEGWPVWSPDGKALVFASSRNGRYDLYRKTLSGAGTEEPVLESSSNKYPSDWSADGRHILFAQVEEKTGNDLWVLPLFGDRKPFALLTTTFDERYAQFSPDGRWVAYQSNESGQDEVYVQPFPGPGEKTQISTTGGTQVRWNRDGKELFYVAPDLRLMAVSVVTSPTAKTLQPAPPTALFVSHLWNNATAVSAKQEYVVSPDGQRFLMLVDPPDAATSPITLIANWAGARK
jgi:Tol biopolymer transport system component